ncbi:hypothetical protein P9139_04125 [Curtobacterium flaccumfaciens]|nr:hypothetical protein P9139_04125 [Curtobacterium flaccumfaciens]
MGPDAIVDIDVRLLAAVGDRRGASYHLQVAVGNIESKDSVQFILN